MKQKLADFFNLLFGFRKFLAWFGLFVVGIIFRVKGLVDGSQFVDLMKATFTGFVASNGVEHIMTTIKQYIDSKGNVIATKEVAPPSGDNVASGDGSVTPEVEAKTNG